MYITNDEIIAKIAEESGTDWIFIDLEIIGKEQRQGNLDTVISRHHIDDVKKIKAVLNKAELLVRVNPIYEGSEDEINKVIENGADIVMLPFFRTRGEAEKFIAMVGGRAKTCLLFETPQAVENVEDIIQLKGIDSIHIGLNDLHLAYKMQFMFELLTDGTVERLCNVFKTAGIPYGFGGIARLGQGTLPAENIITEHYRLGSGQVILSRSFCNVNKMTDMKDIEAVFKTDVAKIRSFEEAIKNKDKHFFSDNQCEVKRKVLNIKNEIAMPFM